MIIDTHVHIWSDDRVTYPMVPGHERPPEQRGSADLLVQEMDRAGVAMAVLVQSWSYGSDDRYLVESMRRFPPRFAASGYMEQPFGADAPDFLERQYHGEGFRGVRIHLANPPSRYDREINEGIVSGAADPLFRRACSLQVPVLFLNRLPTHPTIAVVADRFPELAVIVDSLGNPNVKESPAFPSSAVFFSLAERPNVYVKLANHVAQSKAGYPWPDLYDYQKRVVDLFGPDRLMWGSNWPVETPEPSYLERLDAVRVHLGFLTAEERERILGGTAMRIWGPPPPGL